MSNDDLRRRTTQFMIQPIAEAIPVPEQTHVPRPPVEPSGLTSLLNQRLAEAVDLAMQLKQAHWNADGPHSISLHEVFDRVHAAVISYADQIAKRIVQLGGIAEGTVRCAAARSWLTDYPLTIRDGRKHLASVAQALSAFRNDVRSAIIDADAGEDLKTSSLLHGITCGLETLLDYVAVHTPGRS